MSAGPPIDRLGVLALVLVLAVAPAGLVASQPPAAMAVAGGSALSGAGSATAAIGAGHAQVANNTTPTPDPGPSGSPVEITGVNVTPATVAQDEAFTVAVTVVNWGRTTEVKTIEFEADYVEVDRTTVTLSPNERRIVEFTHRFADPGNKTVELDHSVTLTVPVRQTRFPDIDVVSIETNEPAIAGKPHAFLVTVVNRGNATGSKTIEFEAEYREVANRTVTLEPAQRETLEFTYRFPEPGTEAVEFDHRYTRNLTVEPAVPDFSVTSVRLADDRVRASEPVRIHATVANTGEADGRYPVELRLGGEVVDVLLVAVPVGEERTVVFTRQLDRPGTYTATVGDVDVGFEVLPTGEGSPATGTAAGSTLIDPPLPAVGLPLDVAVVLPVSAVVVLLVAAARRRP